MLKTFNLPIGEIVSHPARARTLHGPCSRARPGRRGAPGRTEAPRVASRTEGLSLPCRHGAGATGETAIFADQAAASSNAPPQAISTPPVMPPSQCPAGMVFSRSTNPASPMIQNRFMTPP